jgi:hypothetical protein
VNRFLSTQYNVRLPYLAEVKLLRQIRNAVQHGAVDPVGDLPRFVQMTERFFASLVSAVFGLAANELRTAILIHPPEVRTLLENAEDAMANGQYLTAVVKCRNAFENLEFAARRTRVATQSLPAVLRAKDEPWQMHYFFRALAEEVDAISRGIDMARYHVFKDYVRHIPHEYWADWRGNSVLQRPWTADDARFAYQFVIDASLQWEARDLDPLRPPVADHGYAWRRWIDGIEIAASAMDMGYIDLKGEQIDVLYCDRALAEAMKTISAGTAHTSKGFRHDPDGSEHTFVHEGVIQAMDVELATHEPERWRVVIWWREYELVPRPA